jgi:hypothetical protein
MKKLCAFLAVAALLTPALGTTALAAGSASVSITGPDKVQQSRSYTYTITLRVSSSFDFIGTASFSGVFSHADVQLEFHSAKAENRSGSATQKVTFKIPANAELGSTGTITITGDGSYLDGNGNLKGFSLKKKTLTATVIAYVPTPTKKPTEWDLAARSAASMKAGDTLNVNGAKDPKIPTELLQALKGRQGKLAVDLGNCTCTIDGAALANIPDAESIDLSMTMEKDAELSAAAGGADVYQMHFAHSGQLPGPFTYRFKAGESKPGDTLYLYFYYDQSGVVEGIQTAVVDADGYVTFTIYHCSSYFVAGGVVEGAAGSLSAPAAGPQPAKIEPTVLPEKQGGEAQDGLAVMQAQLKAAQDNAGQFDGQLKRLESELKAAQDEAAALKAGAEGKVSVEPTVLAWTVFGTALLAAFLTMLCCRAGLFKRKQKPANQAGAGA